MLKIQVLGKGLIPRGLGLAPRKTPFNADYPLIGTLLSTPGLSLTYKNPEDGRLLPLTRQNVKRVWDKYANWDEQKPAASPTHPSVPENVSGAAGEDPNAKKEADDDKLPEAGGDEKIPEPEDPPKPEPVPEVKKENPEPTPAPEVKEEKVEEKAPEAKDGPVVTSVNPTGDQSKPAGPATIPTVLNNGQKNNQQNNQKNNQKK